MPKYINADVLKFAIRHNMDMQDLYLPYMFIDLINETPESIVRCKDCKFYEKLSEDTDTKICSFWEAELGRQAICNFMPTDFCSYGERKEADNG